MSARVFEVRSEVRWGDMDAFGHLNNTVYLRFMEDARIAWFRTLDLLVDGSDHGPILARVECDFRKPVTYPAVVITRQTVTRVGRSSVGHDIELLLEGSDELVATGKSVIVWIDYASGASAPWTDPQRALFSV